MNVPTLRTERLTLRGQEPKDTEILMQAFADDDFSRFITREGRGLSREEAWRPIAMVPGSWAVAGYGQWMVEKSDTGEAVGRLGPWAPEGWPDFEVGWTIFPAHQGNGYAVEGAAAAIAWSHEALGRDHVIHLIDPDNHVSERVARALGAEVTGDWTVPSGGHARIWTTLWDRFTATPAYARLVAARAATA
jgi:RimJ/RimL family protein N-acetyltransferase